MALPYFYKYKFTNTAFNANTGKIYDIDLTGGTAPYTVYWYGPSGYTSGPHITNPSTDITGLTAGLYTGVVTDNIAQSSNTIVEIGKRLELILSAGVTDYSCVNSGPTCKIKVFSFQHSLGCFRYDLYNGLTIVQTYTGCTGDEVYEFSGISDSSYIIKATELSEITKFYTHVSGCTTDDVQIGDTTNPDSIISGWSRFCFFANALDGALPIIKSGIDNTGYIASGTSGNYFYTGNTNPYYLGEYALVMDEGDDVGPSAATNNRRFYYNSIIKKFVVEIDVAGAGIYQWSTFNPTVELSLSGNPTSTNYLTSSINWSTSNLTSNQFTVSGINNTVVTASTKILNAGGNPKMILCSQNSALINGFYSPCEYLNYTHEVTIGSTDFDDDNIGIVLAGFRDRDAIYGVKDITHTLMLTFNIAFKRMGIYYNSGQSAYSFTDGLTGYSPTVYVTGNTPYTGFTDGFEEQGFVRVKITRSGDNGEFFRIQMTDTMGNNSGIQTRATKNVGTSNPYNPKYEFSFSLLDKTTWLSAPTYATGSELTKFLGSQRYGYSTQSQRQSNFFDLNFSGQENSIIAMEQFEIGSSIDEPVVISSGFTGSCQQCITICSGIFTKQTIDNVSTDIKIISDDGTDLSNCFIMLPEIICDPKPHLDLTNCGCEIIGEDSALSLCIDVNERNTNTACTVNDSFNIILNPNGNDGVLYNVDNFETCTLNIAFDYLFKFNCAKLFNVLYPNPNDIVNTGCTTILDVFEKLDVSIILNVISGSTLLNIYEENFFSPIGSGNLYEYVKNTSGNTGFFVTSNDINGIILGPTEQNCPIISDNIVDNLWIESNLPNTPVGQKTFINNVNVESFNSDWLNLNINITDDDILKQLVGKKIKLTLKFNHICSDLCILLDNIRLNKVCNKISSNTINITKSPGFELDRIIDNKKSWKTNKIIEQRVFDIKKNNGTQPIRQTDYIVNDERLVINTKEIDLDINIASAIENDVWSFITDNLDLLDGCGSGNTCCTPNCINNSCCGDNKIDFNDLLTQPLSSVTTVEDFVYFIASELIDVKNRQTITGYATLKALYDRYLNSSLYSSNFSSSFNYLSIDNFAKLVGSYWVDIVEQVVPATTIWGSTKVYSNTIFDQQKFAYKSYTLQLCGNPLVENIVLSPIVNACHTANTITTMLSANTAPLQTVVKSICDVVCIIQGNSGSEFIGKVKTAACDDVIIINECNLSVNITTHTGGTADTYVIGGEAPYKYYWSNGQTTSSASGLTNGTYTLTIIDKKCCGITVTFIYSDLDCGNKQFMDGDCFYFMDGQTYDFMN